MKSISTPKTG